MRNKNLGNLPSVSMPRSSFDLSHGVSTSMSVGKLYPIDWQEVLPGDSIKCKALDVSRVTSSFLKPVMDNLYLDCYHFFVPYRLCFDNAKEVFGVSKPSAYTSDQLSQFPATYGQVFEGSVGDYLGLPPAMFSLQEQVSVIPFRAFALIVNNWFRNENVQDEVYVQTGDFKNTELLNDNPWSANNYTGKLPSVPKYKDYFTSCLPQPQKGADVLLPLGSTAPVNPFTLTVTNGVFDDKFRPTLYTSSGIANVPHYLANDTPGGLMFDSQSTPSINAPQAAYMSLSTNSRSDITVDLSKATAASINEQRMAFALQRMLERDAIFGTRYNEFLLGHFGVYSPDSRLQIPEYLGGSRTPINVIQVAQTSQGTEESPLGNLAGYSWTNGNSRFEKGFTEHGIIMTVACLRYHHTYQQGVPKKWTRFVRDDFYDPLFATIGMQPVYKSELYKDSKGGSKGLREDVFGYNEAWIEYRNIPNSISGQMRSSSSKSLDIWHFADKYASAPTLSASFIQESASNVDRTLSVPSTSIDSFIFNFWFEERGVRVMPTYSMPGLIDHH